MRRALRDYLRSAAKLIRLAHTTIKGTRAELREADPDEAALTEAMSDLADVERKLMSIAGED